MLNKDLIGKSGEFLVASKLALKSFQVNLLLGNSIGYDILAKSYKSKKMYSFQVKTTIDKKDKWALDVKNENLIEKDLFYVFVNLNNNEEPRFYVVPSKDVANYIKESHEKWLKQKGKNNKLHNDNRLRNYIPDKKYANAWNLLK